MLRRTVISVFVLMVSIAGCGGPDPEANHQGSEWLAVRNSNGKAQVLVTGWTVEVLEFQPFFGAQMGGGHLLSDSAKSVKFMIGPPALRAMERQLRKNDRLTLDGKASPTADGAVFVEVSRAVNLGAGAGN